MKVKTLSHLPQRKVTVDQILETEQITEILDRLHEHRHEIDQFLLVYTDRDGTPYLQWVGNNERLLYALEQAKMELLGCQS